MKKGLVKYCFQISCNTGTYVYKLCFHAMLFAIDISFVLFNCSQTTLKHWSKYHDLYSLDNTQSLKNLS